MPESFQNYMEYLYTGEIETLKKEELLNHCIIS